MPRRKRIHIPGFLWHITHRCHKKEHLSPSFKIKQYGEVRFKSGSSFGENDRLQDYVISESQIAYDADSTPENWALRGENAVFWNDFPLITSS